MTRQQIRDPQSTNYCFLNGALKRILRSGGVFAIGSSLELLSSQIEEKLSQPEFLMHSGSFCAVAGSERKEKVSSSVFACNRKEMCLDLALML